jgi:hypothetical protein
MRLNRELDVYGPYCYELDKYPLGLGELKKLCDVASEFAIVNSMAPEANDPHGQVKKRRRIKKLLREFPVLTATVNEAVWAYEWPGTVSSHPTLLVIGKAINQCMDEVIASTKSIYWHGPNGWQDLMLFSDGRLLFYVCSHAKIGSAFLTADLSKHIGLPAITIGSNVKFRIEGDQMPSVLLADLLNNG